MAQNFTSRYPSKIDAFFNQLNPLDSGRTHTRIEMAPIQYASMAGFLFLNYAVVLLFMAFVVCLLKI